MVCKQCGFGCELFELWASYQSLKSCRKDQMLVLHRLFEEISVLQFDSSLLSHDIFWSFVFLLFYRFDLRTLCLVCLFSDSLFVWGLDFELTGSIELLSELGDEVVALALNFLEQLKNEMAMSKV